MRARVVAALLALVMVVAVGVAGCGDDDAPGTQVRMDFARPGDFWAAPFPSDDLVRAGKKIAIESFPNPEDTPLIAQVIQLIGRSVHGFATSGGVFFALTAPVDPAGLPDLAGSIAAGSPVFLMGVDAAAPDAGRRYPVDVSFDPAGGVYGADNLLSLVPLQGIPLRPNTRYAAVVLRSVRDAKGQRLGVPASLSALLAGKAPAGLGAEGLQSYRAALEVLAERGVNTADIAGLAVFTTDDPTAQLRAFLAHTLTLPRPAPATPLAPAEVFDDYCVYASTIAMPDFQSGEPPFERAGGEWLEDATGKPVLARMNVANLFVTIPRRAQPATGYPTVLFVRTGGGGDRPLVDRGVHAAQGGAAITPGSGPARDISRAGYAGVSVNGPLGGRRNVTMGDEQFLVFNVFNPPALRDTIRQSALELALMAHIIGDLRIDATACPGVAATVQLDDQRLALMGHSTGAWISGLVLGIEPRFRAGILSGFGGSSINNVLYKQKPIEVLPALRLLVSENDLRARSPVLTLLQWGAESADPQVYARRTTLEPAAGEKPRHILMVQGIVDHYILPRIANATSLALGLDLAGTPLDEDVGVPDQIALGNLLAYSGAHAIPLPAGANLTIAGTPTTAIVVQHPSDGIEDGHEVMFQLEAPKHEYRCFLESLLTGAPKVPRGGASATDPCPP